MQRKDVRLTKDVVPTRYEMTLKPDLEKFVFEGIETIHLELKKPTKAITLHSIELEIDSAGDYGDYFVSPRPEDLVRRKARDRDDLLQTNIAKRQRDAEARVPRHIERQNARLLSQQLFAERKKRIFPRPRNLESNDALRVFPLASTSRR